MLAGRIGLESLPTAFPIFPLTGAVLLPHGRLPLNIFEPRYLAMTEDALANGRHIAMIQPNPAAIPGTRGPGLHRVGCLGRMVSFSEAPGGRYLITLLGVARFTVADELEMTRGYRRVHGNYTGFADDLDDLEPGPPTGLDRPALFEALSGYFVAHGIDADLAGLGGMSDPALVVTLVMGCPFAPAAKQALLEAPTLAERASALLTLLRIDMHPASADDVGRPS